MERAVRRAAASRSRPAARPPTSTRPWPSPSGSASRCSCGRATCSAAGRCRSSTTATSSPRPWPSSPASARSGGRAACRPSARCSIDRFLEDATEVDVDAIRDHTGEVLIGGVMEHVEEAGVHSGDSACAIPPPTLPPLGGRGDRGLHAGDRRRASTCAGLINVQYAVTAATRCSCIEANPRASRTVPFVAKATGVPLAKVAARVMLGATLAELRAEGLLRRPVDRRPRRRQGGGAAVQPLPRGRHRARPGDALDRRGDGHRRTLRPGLRQGRDWPPAPRCPPTARCSCRWPTATSRPGSSWPGGFAELGLGHRRHHRARPSTWPGSASTVDQRGRQAVRGAPARRPSSCIAARQDQLRRQHAAGAVARAPTARTSARPPTCTRCRCVTTVEAALAAAAGHGRAGADQLTVRSLQEYHARCSRVGTAPLDADAAGRRRRPRRRPGRRSVGPARTR